MPCGNAVNGFRLNGLPDERASRKLLEIANATEAIQDCSIHIEKINGPFLQAGGTPAEYSAGLALA